MKIFENTVNERLMKVLNYLMSLSELDSFRLVGGTSLSLQLGHRLSVDIDLFTDSDYGTIDFDAIEAVLLAGFPYVGKSNIELISFGRSYYVGDSSSDCVKVDIYYCDKFVYPLVSHGKIRMAHVKDIVAMKLEAISNRASKKDFWDIHELLSNYSFEDMYQFYSLAFPYSKSKDEIFNALANPSVADDDFDPICLRGKYWEIIKLDIEDWLKA